MSLKSPANKLMIGLAAVIFVTFAAGCTREVIKEVPVERIVEKEVIKEVFICLIYTSPSPRDRT